MDDLLQMFQLIGRSLEDFTRLADYRFSRENQVPLT